MVRSYINMEVKHVKGVAKDVIKLSLIYVATCETLATYSRKLQVFRFFFALAA